MVFIHTIYFGHVYFSIFCPHLYSACSMFKRVSTCIYGMTYDRYMKIEQFNSIVWGSLRLAPTSAGHCISMPWCMIMVLDLMRGVCENLQWTENCFSSYRSDSFKSSYARLHELHAIVPSGVPLLAATITMKGYQGWQTKYEGMSDYMCATKSAIRISTMKFVFLQL